MTHASSGDDPHTPLTDGCVEAMHAFQTVVDATDVGTITLDGAGAITTANDRFCQLVGHEEEDVLETPFTTLLEAEDPSFELFYDQLDAGDPASVQVSTALSNATDRSVQCDLHLQSLCGDPTTEAVLVIINPDADAASDDTNDPTATEARDDDRKAHVHSLERQVRQQRAIADFGQKALIDRDLDGLIRAATDLVASGLDVELTKVLELDADAETLRLRAGVGWNDGVVGNATVGTDTASQAGYTLLSADPVVVSNFETETRFRAPSLLEDHGVESGISVVIGDPENPWGVFGAHTTTSRQFTEQDIAFVRSIANVLAAAISRVARERDLERYETIVESIWDGVYALDPDDNFVMVNDAYCAMTGYDRDDLIGSRATLVHNATIQQTVQEMAAEMRGGDREMATIELDLTKRDGTSIPAEARFGPYPYENGADGRAGVVRDITERRAWEREVEMLNDLNEVVREITHALVESNARADVEKLVCERLGAADSYEFAWLGAVADDGTTITSIAEAGVSDYPDDVTITADDSETGRGPTSRALREQRPVFATNVLEDGDAPWHDARERGYRSVAAIPIRYQNIEYGVLTIHSARVDAFGEHEQRILSQVGDVIGHAINAIERKEALMADRITEVTFRTNELPDVFRTLGAEMGVVSIDRVVPLNDGTVLQYHSVREMSPAAYKDALANAPWVTDIREINSSAEVTRFEVVTEEPTASSTLATYGGRLHSITFTQDSVTIEAELPESVDIRQVSNAVCERYPGIELVSRHTIDRQVTMPQELAESLIGQLTERQHTSLKSAYYAGFFDWPRASAGTDVAASLDVSPATFHEHVRRAQRKIFTTLFEVSQTAD